MEGHWAPIRIDISGVGGSIDHGEEEEVEVVEEGKHHRENIRMQHGQQIYTLHRSRR